jgi:hypothetical protein
MRESIELGCSPSEEDCSQVGSPDYYLRAKKECRALIGQLRRQFGNEPGTARLGIKSNLHYFGTYHEVVCHFDENDNEGRMYAYKCEGEFPFNWDEIAREELQV